MTDTKVSPTVIFNGRKYYGIKEFDCHVIYLFTEETKQGTFLTTIPISSLEYREKNPTKASIHIETKRGWTTFTINSDYGLPHVIKIHNSLSEEIEFAKQKAVEHGLQVIK